MIRKNRNKTKHIQSIAYITREYNYCVIEHIVSFKVPCNVCHRLVEKICHGNNSSAVFVFDILEHIFVVFRNLKKFSKKKALLSARIIIFKFSVLHCSRHLYVDFVLRSREKVA